MTHASNNQQTSRTSKQENYRALQAHRCSTIRGTASAHASSTSQQRKQFPAAEGHFLGRRFRKSIAYRQTISPAGSWKIKATGALNLMPHPVNAIASAQSVHLHAPNLGQCISSRSDEFVQYNLPLQLAQDRPQRVCIKLIQGPSIIPMRLISESQAENLNQETWRALFSIRQRPLSI